jgi:uracil-DNA glycosylase
VAQDDNEKTEYKSLSDRSGEVRSSGQRPFSSETSDLSDKAGSRNRHMKGTTSLLRLIFKIGLGCDWQGEFLQINGKRVHIFDAFALLNSSPCTAERPSGSAKPTNTMLQNCSNHLKAALEELAPTMIVAEGNLAAEALRMAGYGSEKSPTIERISTSYGPIMLLKFKHPSARGKFNWGSNERMPIY